MAPIPPATPRMIKRARKLLDAIDDPRLALIVLAEECAERSALAGDIARRRRYGLALASIGQAIADLTME